MVWSVPADVASGAEIAAATTDAILADLRILGGAWTTDGRAATTIWNGTLGTGGTLASTYRLVGAGGGTGGTLDWNVEITLGSGFTIGTNLTIPFTMASAISPPSSDCFAWDASANAWWPLYVIPGSTTGLTIRTLPAVANSNLVVISSTVPFTFAAGDVIAVKFSGRAA